MRLVFVTVTDGFFFPGTVATVNSVLRFHPGARICVVNNHVQKDGVSSEQRKVLEEAGVAVVNASALCKPGRKLAAWELKAYAAADLPEKEDVLIGIDSDCVLCGPVDDIAAEAAATGRFLGGRDNNTRYGDDYGVYGIETPVENRQYMSASLYACALSAENRRVLEKWAECCDRAIFGGGGIYPGHGDQGVLNAVLFAERGSEGVRVLENTLWSQHHCYWQHALELRGGALFNSVADAPQRALHCGGTEKFWSARHVEKLRSCEKHALNYCWYLALLWYGRCVIEPGHLDAGHGHLATSLARYRYQIAEFVRMIRPEMKATA